MLALCNSFEDSRRIDKTNLIRLCIVSLPARSEADEIAAMMLAQSGLPGDVDVAERTFERLISNSREAGAALA